MKNEEKFKTAEEREEAFNHMCCARQCSECKYQQLKWRHWCSFAWLSDEYEEPKPDLPFKLVLGGSIPTIRSAETDRVIRMAIDGDDEHIAIKILREQCDEMNAAALAWHERMCKEPKGANA